MPENTPTGNVMQAMTELMESIANWAKQVLEQIVPALQTIYNAIYEQYQQAGAPYRDTQEGCLRWMRELAEVRQLEARAEYIIAHHQGLAYLRKQLAEKRMDVPQEGSEK